MIYMINKIYNFRMYITTTQLSHVYNDHEFHEYFYAERLENYAS